MHRQKIRNAILCMLCCVSPVNNAKGTITRGVRNPHVLAGEEEGRRVLITRIEPTYPPVLERMRVGGLVRLQLTVSQKGTVENVEVLGGNPILADAAVFAAKQWVYSPSHSRSVITVSIRFTPSH
jgi:TonB family protein